MYSSYLIHSIHHYTTDNLMDDDPQAFLTYCHRAAANPFILTPNNPHYKAQHYSQLAYAYEDLYLHKQAQIHYIHVINTNIYFPDTYKLKLAHSYAMSDQFENAISILIPLYFQATYDIDPLKLREMSDQSTGSDSGKMCFKESIYDLLVNISNRYAKKAYTHVCNGDNMRFQWGQPG